MIKVISAQDTKMETQKSEFAAEIARLEAKIEQTKQELMRWTLVVVGAAVAFLAMLNTATTLFIRAAI